VSLSTLNKSTCVLEPAVEAATRLRAWYSTVGATVQTVEAGAGLVGSGGGGGAGGAGRATRKSLSELVDAPLLSPDAKPEWATLHGCVVHIQPDSSLYYCACPEEGCNKKVVQDGGGWLCEATGHRFPECKRRYILRFKAADATCAAWVNAFDDQGRQMFGCSADELNAEKEGVCIARIYASRGALTRAHAGQCRLPAAPEGSDLEALDHEDQVHNRQLQRRTAAAHHGHLARQARLRGAVPRAAGAHRRFVNNTLIAAMPLSSLPVRRGTVLRECSRQNRGYRRSRRVSRQCLQQKQEES